MQVGDEVWYRDARGGGEWRRVAVTAVHLDDAEKYFSIRRADGTETQTELMRLRRHRPHDAAAVGGRRLR
jgi:hypothetical protein